jgi:hypothetical protein
MKEKQNKTIGVRLAIPVFNALVQQSDTEDVGMSLIVQRALVSYLGLGKEHIPEKRKRRSDQITRPPKETYAEN